MSERQIVCCEEGKLLNLRQINALDSADDRCSVERCMGWSWLTDSDRHACCENTFEGNYLQRHDAATVTY